MRGEWFHLSANDLLVIGSWADTSGIECVWKNTDAISSLTGEMTPEYLQDAMWSRLWDAGNF